MTKFVVVSSLYSHKEKKYLEPGETVELDKATADILLPLKVIRLPGDAKPEPEPKPLPTLEELLGKRLAEKLILAGFLNWDVISFATDEQLMAVEGLTEEKLKDIRKKVPKEGSERASGGIVDDPDNKRSILR